MLHPLASCELIGSTLISCEAIGPDRQHISELIGSFTEDMSGVIGRNMCARVSCCSMSGGEVEGDVCRFEIQVESSKAVKLSTRLKSSLSMK